jgi:uncharacterized membrane protein
MTIIHFAIINIGALMAAAGGVFLKRLSDQLNHQAAIPELVFHILKSSNFWLGGVCFVLPIFLWTYLLKYMELTKLQPQLSIVYIYTILLSIIFLGEMPSLARLLGVALIVAGVIVIGQS